MPAVSVIIPMYNVRPYIEDCLLSLKRQTFGDFEALCVDDGSTDGTLEAARKAEQEMTLGITDWLLMKKDMPS